MTHRLLFRMALRHDTNSRVRDAVDRHLSEMRIVRPSGGSDVWEGKDVSPAALSFLADVLRTLSSVPESVEGADPDVAVEQIWLYVEPH